MAEAIYSERACALKTPHEDHTISNLRASIAVQCGERGRDGNGPVKTATMDDADRQLLATLLFPADAADDGAMPVEGAEDLVKLPTAWGDRLIAFAYSEMIGILVDRQSHTVLPDRPASSGLEQQA